MLIHHFGFRYRLLALVVVAWPGLLLAQDTPNPPNSTVPLSTPPAQACYGIGRQIGQDLGRGGLDGDLLDINALMLGIQDALGQTESRITQEQFETAVNHIHQIAHQRMQQKMQAAAARNRQDGPKFLERYKATEGVKQTATGLLYKVVKQGDGPSPKTTDVVQTHYRGRLIDGSEFDSSYKRNEPAQFQVGGVIAGWTEALQMMKVGDRWQLVIPPELAYGSDGSPPDIGPEAVLIFDIELLGIVDPSELLPQGDALQP